MTSPLDSAGLYASPKFSYAIDPHIGRRPCWMHATANANKITVRDGASNGYLIFGQATGEIDVFPGQICEIVSYTQADLATIVAATNDEIDFAGTAAQSIHVLIVVGT